MEIHDIKFASFWKRLIARIIDTLINTLLVIILSKIIIIPADGKKVLALFLFLFYLFYYPIMEANGVTIGKRIMNIKSVSSKSLLNISLKQAYKRSLFFIWSFLVLIFLGVIFGVLNRISDINANNDLITLAIIIFLVLIFLLSSILGPLALLWSKKKQGWHDQWSDTYVIELE